MTKRKRTEEADEKEGTNKKRGSKSSWSHFQILLSRGWTKTLIHSTVEFKEDFHRGWKIGFRQNFRFIVQILIEASFSRD